MKIGSNALFYVRRFIVVDKHWEKALWYGKRPIQIPGIIVHCSVIGKWDKLLIVVKIAP